MHKRYVNGGGGGDYRLRRQNKKEKGVHLSNFLADAHGASSPEQPASASSLRRHVAASLMQHHRSVEKNSHALRPLSPASYRSSMEVTHYNPAVTPSSSLDFKGRIGETKYRLQTSTELLKVLNRIWSLEEQQASNISLIKILKKELRHARSRIKDLLRDQQADRHERCDLMKRIAEDKLVRKSKEPDRMHAAAESVRDELEDERRLRKRSESLYRKLDREISEVKHSLANVLKELERERKTRNLLEDLCDEFAKGIKAYDQEMHVLKQKSDNDWTEMAKQDSLILHISESWLDERTQINLEAAQHGCTGKKSILDKLSFEIEAFLQAKKECVSKSFDNSLPRDRRSSLESVPLNEVRSAPQDAGDDQDFGVGDSNCFELNKPSNNDLKSHVDEVQDSQFDETVKPNHRKSKPSPSEKVNRDAPSSLQVKFEEQMAWAMSCNGNKNSWQVESEHLKIEDGKPETKISQKSKFCEATENGNDAKKKGHQRSNSNYTVDKLLRSQSPLPESKNITLEDNCTEASCSKSSWRNGSSPVPQWIVRPATPGPGIDTSESSLKLLPSMKEHILKAQRLEERSKGQWKRLNFFKGSSQVY